MGEKDFTNREIGLMFEQIRYELTHIREQTTKTNGRVSASEVDIKNLGTFQTRVLTIWGVAIAGLTVAVNKFFI